MIRTIANVVMKAVNGGDQDTRVEMTIDGRDVNKWVTIRSHDPHNSTVVTVTADDIIKAAKVIEAARKSMS